MKAWRDLQRVGGDEHALDDLVRVALDEQVVLEGGRLALVAVDHEVGDRVLAQHRPLAPGREAGAAPAEQAGRVDLGRHRLGRHGQRLAQRRRSRRWPGSAPACASRRSPRREVTILGASVMAIRPCPPPAAAARAALASAMRGPLGHDGVRVGLQADACGAPGPGCRAAGRCPTSAPGAQVVDQRVEASRASARRRSGG